MTYIVSGGALNSTHSLWRVENRRLPLTRPMDYTTAGTTVQAVIQQMVSTIPNSDNNKTSYQ